MASRTYCHFACDAGRSDCTLDTGWASRPLFTGRTGQAGALSARRSDLTRSTDWPARTLWAGGAGDACAWGARRSDWTYGACGAGGAIRAGGADHTRFARDGYIGMIGGLRTAASGQSID